MPEFEIIAGDSLEVLRTMAENSVHCVVTSPPYWGLRDYGVTGQIGLERTPAEYIEKMVRIFAEVRRVLRPDGTLWMNMGDCYATGAGAVGECPGGGERGARWKGEITRARDDKRGYRGERLANGRGDEPTILRKKTNGRGVHLAENSGKAAPRIAAMGPMTQPNRMPIAGLKPKDLVGMPWRLAFALQADGWYLRSDIIWHKPNPMPESVLDRPTKAHEYIFLMTKSERYFYDQEAILEPVSAATHARLSQDVQSQIGSDRAHAGGKTNGNMKAVGRRPSAWDNDMGSHRTLVAGYGRKLAEPNSGTKNNESFDAAMAIMPEKRNKRTVWTVPTQSFTEAHLATFPEDLITPCILAGSAEGGTVLDPFAGSGTTGVVALRYHRKFVGIELNPGYREMAIRRIIQDAPLFNTCAEKPAAVPSEPCAQPSMLE